jgi:hypothetical protein
MASNVKEKIMAFTKTFYSDLSVTQANPTKLNEYTKVASNSEAIRERFLIGHWFNDTGVVGASVFFRRIDRTRSCELTWIFFLIFSRVTRAT